MNSKLFFIILVLLGTIVIFGSSSFTQSNQTQTPTTLTPSSPQALKSQSISMGAVDIGITPTLLDPDNNIVFAVTLNTHSVELDFDYTKIISLTDNTGRTYQASEWTGGRSGHHSTGQLIFTPLSSTAQEITMIIDGIENQTETLTWNL